MSESHSKLSRRALFKTSAAAGVGLVGLQQALAQDLRATPKQPEGPFYPVNAQSDLDADLTLLEGHRQRARGEVVLLQVEVVDTLGRPIPNALVDLWQACATGRYNHPEDPNTSAALDEDFQYWAKVRTASNGTVTVKTIKPGAYPAAADWVRPPHIHFKISADGFLPLTTPLYFAGDSLNEKDQILMRLRPAERAGLIVDFSERVSDGRFGELPLGRWNVVLASVSPLSEQGAGTGTGAGLLQATPQVD